ncbi:seryl-tRNA(Sec) selenium transferase [Desulfosporosinus orientis DSM 765]|uniref:L-seryl-tRNA(Sec) selenium transferase n=1 Tax=Desulfosporosinus orientis (strain ATCC 19365 / DSM 765 / NCIMB 8382 / VKM B-1628 / Singapore I) TaxID=768706 RepID=G7WHW1_DESOD|nr:L-seryl-tRNA(Sec) selenium transferase [Desulfosporosinus orientis]AET70258.1 seryl-tRNA(Sec) selenium transferase [Desulfosporosinus orientis DSM 765]
MQQEIHRRLRALPAVHEVISRLEDDKEFGPFMTNERSLPRVTRCVRQVLQNARETINETITNSFEEFEASLWSTLRKEILEKLKTVETSLQRVINATGVVLHTNCGRALLAPEVARFVAEHAERYSNLELNIKSGERGSRYVHVEELLCRLTGAEAAMVVNNNAAAVLLMMNTFAQGKEVIVSRGELVEVGGSFRIPEVLKAGGAKLVEVGATNKTWLKDYEEAIGPETAMLLKVHSSNYRIEGFTHTVSGAELVELGDRWGVPVMEDLGSGSFFDGASLGFPPEPTIKQAVRFGLSLVSFSGDKLLGGPQAGIIVGKKVFIEKLRANQLTRALRIDKLTLAALEGTLRLYDNEAVEEIPVWRMLSVSLETLQNYAAKLVEALKPNKRITAELKKDFSQVGGGAWPTVKLPTWVCAVKPKNGNVVELENFLRSGPVAIITRIHKDWIFMDVRTLLGGDIEDIVQRLEEWN